MYNQQQEVIALQQEYYALYSSLPDASKAKIPHTDPAPVPPGAAPKLDIYQLHSDILRVAGSLS